MDNFIINQTKAFVRNIYILKFRCDSQIIYSSWYRIYCQSKNIVRIPRETERAALSERDIYTQLNYNLNLDITIINNCESITLK